MLSVKNSLLSDNLKTPSTSYYFFSTIFSDATLNSSLSSPIIKPENYIFVGLLQFLFGGKSKGQEAFHLRKIVKWLALKRLPK